MLSFLFFFYLLSSLTIYDIDNEFERELLSIRSIFSLVRPYKLSYIYSMLKQYSFFFSQNFCNILRTCASFFFKGSKKEFSSEKINSLLLKKKKQDAFLKKFYRS